MKRLKLILALVVCLLSASNIYSSNNSEAVSLFRKVQSVAENGQETIVSLTYYLLYEEPFIPVVRHRSPVAAAVKSKGEINTESGTVLSENISSSIFDIEQPVNIQSNIQSTAGMPQVLGSSVSDQNIQYPVGEINERYIDQMIMFNLQNVIAQGWLNQSQTSVDRSRTVINNYTGIGKEVIGALAGSILFSDGAGNLAQNNSNLFWDDTNKQIGIGTASPAEPLHIVNSVTGEGIRLQGDRPALSFYDSTGVLAASIRTSNDPVGALRGLEFRTPDVTGAGGNPSDNWNIMRFNGSANKIYFGDTGAVSWLQFGHTLNIKANAGSAGNNTAATPDLVINSGKVGIGTASPVSILHLAADGNIEQLISRASNDSSVPALTFRKSYGTHAAPIAATGNEGIGEIKFTEYDGSSFLTAASINVQSEIAPTTGAVNGRIRFYTANSTGGNVERMRLSAAGNLGIGTTNPTSKLHVLGTGSFNAAGVSALNLSAHTATLTASPATFRASEIGAMTLAAASAQTVTNASSLYVATPIAGSNVTITNNKPIDTQTTAYLSSGGTWTNASSRELKENFTALDPQEVLDKIDALSIERWNYKAENASITHIAPVAEEFHAAFNTGGIEGDRTISTIDPAGVALLGIQGLSAKLKSLLDMSWIIDGLKEFGVEISENLTKIKSLAVEKFQIGSSENPSGVVMYDKATKEAYCVEIENGEFVKTPGECDDDSEQAESSESSSIEEPVSEPVQLRETIPVEESIEE